MEWRVDGVGGREGRGEKGGWERKEWEKREIGRVKD